MPREPFAFAATVDMIERGPLYPTLDEHVGAAAVSEALQATMPTARETIESVVRSVKEACAKHRDPFITIAINGATTSFYFNAHSDRTTAEEVGGNPRLYTVDTADLRRRVIESGRYATKH